MNCEHCGHPADRHSPAYYLCNDCDCDNFDGVESSWIDINERLPSEDGRYLVTYYDGRDRNVDIMRFTESSFYFKGHTEAEQGVCAWRELPTAFEQ